jgi:hypothetical protein
MGTLPVLIVIRITLDLSIAGGFLSAAMDMAGPATGWPLA